MSWVLGATLLGLVASLTERWRRGHAGGGLEAVVLQATTGLVLVGLVATVLASVDMFTGPVMSVAIGGLAAGLFPWRWKSRRWLRPKWRAAIPMAAIVLGGLALRLPVMHYELAGRDQGTYTLRARLTARTGSLGLTDPAIAQAGTENPTRPGPADILGLYPRRHEPWRRGLYEAAYRPGFYLSDRNAGQVVPQFFHLHPMLMATTELVLGPGRGDLVIPLEAMLALLAMWIVARRLWPRGPWAWLATALMVLSPLIIWVQRTALSETLAGLLILAAAAAVLRARAHRGVGLERAALLLGAVAWTRGDGFVAAPITLAVLWLIPPHDRARARPTLIYLGLLVGSVLVHASTVYPYLHDEFIRHSQAGWHPVPLEIAAWTVVGALAWVGVDRSWLHQAERDRGAGVARYVPWIVTATIAMGVVAWVIGRLGGPSRPFSRLDLVVPVAGPAILGLAAVGLSWLVRQTPRRGAADVWLWAIAAQVATAVVLFAPRNLPQAGLYYYGRYLVPHVLPALILLATTGLWFLHGRGFWLRALAERRRRWAAAGLAGLGAAALVASSAGILALRPITRLQEFEGAGALVKWLAQRVPPDAVIIAGGEGWHHGHTFNQVGGALAVGYGHTVVPYRTAEAAYATATELLIHGPRARGEPAPPVFLLVNEATHNYRPRTMDGEPGPEVRAALDDRLPPPLRATRIDLLEMFVHRLTPDPAALPTRVTRDGLRMALLELDVDRLQAPTEFDIAGPPPRGFSVRGGLAHPLGLCLEPEGSIIVELPPGVGPGSWQLVAIQGTARKNPTLPVLADGVPVDPRVPRQAARPRDTVGPFAFVTRPKTLEIQPLAKPVRQAPCPRGGIAKIRLLGPDRAASKAAIPIAAHAFVPRHDLGHRFEPATWVRGAGLSRYRAGIRPVPRIEAVSLVLEPGTPLRLPPSFVPDDGRHELDVVVTLTRTRVSPEARLEVAADTQRVGDIVDPPDDRGRSWQSTPARWMPDKPVVEFSLTLRDGGEGEFVRVRDIALFSTGPVIAPTAPPGP